MMLSEEQTAALKSLMACFSSDHLWMFREDESVETEAIKILKDAVKEIAEFRWFTTSCTCGMGNDAEAHKLGCAKWEATLASSK